MGEPRISVIVPVYNMAGLVGECIHSIQVQSEKNIEIICVDDGSTDESAGIIEGMMSGDARIRLISQENGGPGAARNMGVDVARGKYVAFLDADDTYLETTALEQMTDALDKYGKDVCGAEFGWEKDGKFLRNTYFGSFDEDIPYEGRWVDYGEYQFDNGFWSFIYRREFLLANQIRFPGYKLYEDPVFFLDAMISAEGFWFLPIEFLRVRVWSHESGRKLEHIGSALDGICENLRKADENGYDILYGKLINRLDVEFRTEIIEGASEEVLSKLFAIGRLNNGSQFRKRIGIIEDIFSAIRNLNRAKAYDARRISSELKEHLRRIGEERFRKYFSDEDVRSVVIYGVGDYGNAFYGLAKTIGLEIKGIMDYRVEWFDGIKTSRIEDGIPECDAVVITPLQYEGITEMVRVKTSAIVMSFARIISKLETKCDY